MLEGVVEGNAVTARGSLLGSSAVKEEVIALPAEKALETRSARPPGTGIKVITAPVIAIATAVIVSARSEARQPKAIPSSAKNVTNPPANPTHGPLAWVKAIPSISIVKGTTQQIALIGDAETPFDFKA